MGKKIVDDSEISLTISAKKKKNERNRNKSTDKCFCFCFERNLNTFLNSSNARRILDAKYDILLAGPRPLATH